MWEVVLKQKLTGIEVATFLGINNFQIIEAMKLIFFKKNEQNFVYILKMQQKFQKMFFIYVIIAFESVAVISPIYDKNTCDLQSMCYEKVLRIWIWLREMFSKSVYPRLMENWDKSVAVEDPAVFGIREHVYCWRLC